MKPKVSIVIPVYNAEKHLKQCLDSILNQTYENIEIICVDDCSSDRSIPILQQFEENDNRIKVLYNEKNSGEGKTRMKGVSNSTGKYVFFSDSDDWLPKKSIEILVAKAEKTNSDIVFGGKKRVLDKFGLISSSSKNSFFNQNLNQSISEPELFDDYYISYFGVNKLSVTMWAKLYRMDIIRKANINSYGFKFGEDLLFNLQIHPFLSKVSFVEENTYFYRFGGITNTSNPTFLKDIKEQYYIKEKHLQDYNYQKAEVFIKIEVVNCFYSHFKNLFVLDRKSVDEVKNLIEEELKDHSFYNNLFYNWDNVNEKGKIIKDRNIDEIVSSLQKSLPKEKIKFRLKTIISNLLN